MAAMIPQNVRLRIPRTSDQVALPFVSCWPV
jgi:hypothetical protein